MSFVLTNPTPGGAVSGINTVTGVIVPAGQTEQIDFIQCDLYRGGKWVLTLTNSVSNACMQQTIAVHINAICTGLSHTRYALIGNIIPHGISVTLEGSPAGASLKVTNPTGDDYIADFVRVDLFE